MPHFLRVGLTFLIVTLAWVFFRSNDLHGAAAYLGGMFGWGHPQDTARLLGGILYKPYYLTSLGMAGIVVWACPNTWSWTFRLTLPKALLSLALLWVALVVMATQEYNPFIYFIF
jgi:alginate O-acetyltransferase complex protein AlgI